MHAKSTICAFWIVALVPLAIVSDSQAQVMRTFVSSSGNDAFRCESSQQPCRSIQAAVNKVSDGGEVLIVSSGTYFPFNINKSLLVTVAPGVDAEIVVGSRANCPFPSQCMGISISGRQLNVVLRGLRLTYTGQPSPEWHEQGILFSSDGGSHCRIADCDLRGFPESGIFAIGGQGQISIDNTTLVRNGVAIAIVSESEGGLFVAAIESCRIDGNYHGLRVRQRAKATIHNSVVTNNSARGIWVEAKDYTSAELVIDNCMITGNGAGIHTELDPGQTGTDSLITVLVSNTTVTHNGDGLVVGQNSEILSRIPATNTVEGNGYNGSFTGTFQAK